MYTSYRDNRGRMRKRRKPSYVDTGYFCGDRLVCHGLDPDHDFWFPRLFAELHSYVGKTIKAEQFGAGNPPKYSGESDVRIMDYTIAYPRDEYVDDCFLVTVSGGAVSMDWDGYIAAEFDPHPCMALCRALEKLREYGERIV